MIRRTIFRFFNFDKRNEEKKEKSSVFFLHSLLFNDFNYGSRTINSSESMRYSSTTNSSFLQSIDDVTSSTKITDIYFEEGRCYGNTRTWKNHTLSSSLDFPSNIVNFGEGNQTRECEKLNNFLFEKWLPIIRIISQVGYATSFATLVVAMLVFSLLRKLRNPRNRLHMHLFASFIMRAFMALLKDWVFVDGIGLAFIKERNIWICKTITSIWQYFIVANYAWIFMEGLYLHNLIFLTFCTDASTITFYIILGWGLPAVVVISWIIIRITVEDTLCWTTHDNPSFFLIIRIPIMISILLNFLLFLNIARVLLVKLKTSVHLQRKKMRYKKWAKSTLVLVPLFGAHYTLFLGLSYNEDDRVELAWLFCDQLFASFQGCFVAFLYCLLNGDVRAEVKRAWIARRRKKDVDLLILRHRNASKNFNNRLKRDRHHPIQSTISSVAAENYSLTPWI